MTRMELLGYMAAVVFVVLSFVAMAYSIYVSTMDRDRLMEECMKDGNPEYVCVGILNGKR